MAGKNENDKRTAVKGSGFRHRGLGGDKLAGFALRLLLTGHVAIPSEGEIDFLAEAGGAFAPAQPKNPAARSPR